MTHMKIAVTGASGRMGRMLIGAILAAPDVVLCGALDRADAAATGSDAGTFHDRQCGVLIESTLRNRLNGADCLIDFTHPDATRDHLAYCVAYGINMVIGTTGLDQAAQDAIAAAAQKIAIVYSPSFSVGVSVVMMLLQTASKLLPAGYEVEIIEAHNRNKLDAPSGTALRMGEVVANARGQTLDQVATYGRQGNIDKRDINAIGFNSIRAGDIISEHTVLFANNAERLEITHKCDSRLIYAEGSIRSARFLMGKTTGLYNLQDVLA